MSIINNRLRKSEFLRNVLTLISASSVAQAVAIAIYPLLTRIYDPGEHGLFALYMSIVSITSIIATGKYELAVMMPDTDRDGAGLSILSFFILINFSLLILIPIILFNDVFALWLGNPDIAFWLYFVPLSTLLIGVFSIFSYWSNRKKKYKRIATANMGQSLINSGIKVSSSGISAPGAGLIIGAIGGQLTGALIFIHAVLRREFPSPFSFRNYNFSSLARKYIFFPRFNMIHSLVNNFSMTLPVFIFSSYFTAAEVGYFSIGFMMINRPMNLFTSSFTQVFSQRIIERYNKGERIHNEVKRFVIRLALLAFIPFLVAGIFGPSLFNFIFGDKWDQAGRFMQLMLPWLFLVFLSSPISFLPDLLNRQRKAMWLDINKFVLRLIALTAGVMLNSIYLAIVFFSAISVLIVSYSLYWYLSLSNNADRKT